DEQSYLDRAKQAREQRTKTDESGGIDWEKARALHQKAESGGTLTADEQAYLEKAKAARAAAEGGAPAGGAAKPGDIDMQRARELHQKRQRCEQPTAHEQAYLQKAIETMRGEKGGGRGGPAPEAKSETGFKPLTDMTDKYKTEDGGLYGGGKNEPPAELAKAAK